MINTTSIKVAVKEMLRLMRQQRSEAAGVLLAVSLLTTAAAYYGNRAFFRMSLLPESLLGRPEANLAEYLYWFVATFVLFFLIPVVLVLVLHRRSFREFGLGIGNWRLGLKVSLGAILIMLPIVWIASDAEAFRAVYPHAVTVRERWSWFLLYEATFLLYFIGWEFLWRGYLQFSLARSTSLLLAILIQTLPFVLLHHGKPVAETLGAIAAGIGLGYLAAFTRSFWYCVVIHWSVMFSIDLLSTLRYRWDIVGIGPDAVGLLLSRFFHF